MLDYKKYRWFFTSSGKLVVGGKNAEQNEELVEKILSGKKKYIVMHTASPGSPFSFIIGEIKDLIKSDFEETAIFTACFSQVWKTKGKKFDVHIFTTSQIYKNRGMSKGTFGVLGEIQNKKAELKLFLIVQDGKLRTTPFDKLKIAKITPGNLTKEQATEKIRRILKEKNLLFAKEEIMQALPAGNINVKEIK